MCSATSPSRTVGAQRKRHAPFSDWQRVLPFLPGPRATSRLSHPKKCACAGSLPTAKHVGSSHSRYSGEGCDSGWPELQGSQVNAAGECGLSRVAPHLQGLLGGDAPALHRRRRGDAEVETGDRNKTHNKIPFPHPANTPPPHTPPPPTPNQKLRKFRASSQPKSN